MTTKQKVLAAIVAASPVAITPSEAAKRARVTLAQARDACCRLAREKVVKRVHADGTTREIFAFEAVSGAMLRGDRKTLRGLVKAYGRDAILAAVDTRAGR